MRRPNKTCLAVLAGGLAAALVATAPGTAVAASPGWERQAMSLSAAHTVSKGDGMTVAVIDTGIVTDQPVLAGRAKNGPDFLKEDDQNESWYGGHGTSMASSVLDVAPNAKVLGLRAIRDREDPDYKTWNEAIQEGPGNNDGPMDALRDAILYAVKHDADVISMSLGDASWTARYDGGEANAIQYALSKGVTVVASAGNSGDLSKIDETGNGDDENNIGYPAGYPGVLTVAATQPGGSRASFSSVHNYVDVSAPGVDIYGASNRGKGRKAGDGTSPAAALTAGTAALVQAKYPKLSPAQVVQVLQKSASHPGTYSPLTGYGQINAAAALRTAAKVKGIGSMPVGKIGAGRHFGPGDDGTAPRVKASIDSEYLTMAALFGVPGLLAIVGGILLAIRGRKARKAAVAPAYPTAY
ncbi:S8 family serine peptidase [Streptomyces boninensis]|uniref:S8 family serine peptidase n=1 Tax=Streptomyces boninensis TaxID=2039455 RepID=UPI003B211623